MMDRNPAGRSCRGVRALTGGCLLAAALAGAAPVHAALPVVLPRPGQIGFTIQGQYGLMLSTGDLGDAFGNGGGLAVRMRYRMRYERALGLSFEAQNFGARTPGGNFAPGDTIGDPAFSRDQLNALLTGVDFYQMFNTDQKYQELLSLSGGLAQVHYVLRDGEIEYPNQGDGLYVAVGGGIERFFYRSFALDVSGRFTALFHGGQTNGTFQAAAGLIFYASY
jgi:hypothetical protein